MMAGGAHPVSAMFPGSRPRAPRRKARRSVETEELAIIVPGGPWKKCSVQKMLLGAISYIQFLQLKIQETHKKLFPHASQHDLLPILTLRYSVDVTRKRRKARPRIRRRWRQRGSVLMPKLNSRRIPRQRLVPYISSSSSDNGDGGPWLVSVSMSPQSPLSPCTPQSSSAATLELSPLLLSPPPALFEELKIGSWLEDDQDPAALSISLDHSYQSCGESSSNSPQPTKESDLVAEFPKSSLQRPVEVASGPGIRRCMKVYGAKSKAKRQLEYSSTSSDTASSTRSIGTVLIQKPRKFSAVQQFRKKCVNGFIMFCSAHPGKASTTATKDLAELWKVMSARERRPYCMKALQFSLLHDRMVKSGSSRFPQENISPLKPVSVLLAEKAAQSQYLGDP